MDEQRVIDLMRGFFAEMQTKLVSEVVKSLTTDAEPVSESSSEKETIIPDEKESGRQLITYLSMVILFSCHLIVKLFIENRKWRRIIKLVKKISLID